METNEYKKGIPKYNMKHYFKEANTYLYLITQIKKKTEKTSSNLINLCNKKNKFPLKNS